MSDPKIPHKHIAPMQLVYPPMLPQEDQLANGY